VELDVRDRLAARALGRVAAGTLDHLRGHVDPDGLARRADLGRCQEHVQAAAAAEVHHHFPRLQAGKGGGIAAGEAHVGLGRDRGQLLGRIAERFGHRAHAFVPARQIALGNRSILGTHDVHDFLSHVTLLRASRAHAEHAALQAPLVLFYA